MFTLNLKYEIYYDKDVDLSILRNKIIAIIGYGNQGRAHALNIRDSGLKVIVGNIDDEYGDKAKKDGFEVYAIDRASALADVVFILLPDEIQPEIYEKYVQNKLKKGKILCFASGFAIHFGLISPPECVDVVMEAPRMLGIGVRDSFAKRRGYPTLVAVHQDASGQAKSIVLGIAKASGGTKGGAFMSSFREEAVLDLFTEQGCLAGLYDLFKAHFEVAVEAGYNPLVVVLELWKSGEILEEVKAWTEIGLFKQMSMHSLTSQYGSLTRGPLLVTHETKRTLKKHLEDIQNGMFAQEWIAEQNAGKPSFSKLKKRVLEHPINKIEEELDKLVYKK